MNTCTLSLKHCNYLGKFLLKKLAYYRTTTEAKSKTDQVDIDEYKSQNIRHLGQISMLQNDKENMQKELKKLKEQVGVLESEVEHLQSAENDRINALSMADLMKRENIKIASELEALQSTVDFLREELDKSKLRSQATLDKYVLSEQNEEKLKLQLKDLQQQLADTEQSKAIVSSPMQQVC